MDARDPKLYRQTLVALLAGDGVTRTMEPHERDFLLTTCAARVIEEAVCAAASYDEREADHGLEVLIRSMRAHVCEICARHKKTPGG